MKCFMNCESAEQAVTVLAPYPPDGGSSSRSLRKTGGEEGLWTPGKPPTGPRLWPEAWPRAKEKEARALLGEGQSRPGPLPALVIISAPK